MGRVQSVILAICVLSADGLPQEQDGRTQVLTEDFYVSQKELVLRFSHGAGARKLAYCTTRLPHEEWRQQCRSKLAELLGLDFPITAGAVNELRTGVAEGVSIVALTMEVSDQLSIPAYLLVPPQGANATRAVLAIHGHGTVEPCIGASDDYHHSFALELAKKGYLVLCPELRGFGVLRDVAAQTEGGRLDYWNWGEHMAYSLVSDGIIHGKPLIGETVEDLLRWEDWLVRTRGVTEIDVAGISYGGDLALIYPVFSERVGRIFASGTLGSFSVIFSRCYNAPAHGIPGVLQWMDRSDIAGLNAPRPLAIHYGELDTPSPTNFSASYNETVPESLRELKAIYGACNAEKAVRLVVSKGKQHEMDNEGLLQFLSRQKDSE